MINGERVNLDLQGGTGLPACPRILVWCFKAPLPYLDITASPYQDGNRRTTVTLDDVYQAAMHLSRGSGERLGKILSTLARRGLTPPAAPSPKKTRRRFPVFEVPSDTPVIPASRVQRAIDEEGYF
jgi:hypothetical protein